MRVLSGTLKNSNFSIKTNTRVLRPTGAVVKKSLFSTLRAQLIGSSFLDLFAGSGAVGIEAFSNGAKLIGFIEKEKSFYLELKKNIKKYHLPAFVLWGSYKSSLVFFKKKDIDFDFIFIDPPYHFQGYEEVILKILGLSLLKKTGIIIIEHAFKNKDLREEFLKKNSLIKIKEKKIGGTILSYFSVV